MADAAEGKRTRNKGRLRRWLLLPAAGATVYAVVRSDFFTRQAKDLVDEAKTRASELPDDLATRVRDTVEASGADGSPARGTTRRSSPRKPSTSRRAGTSGKARTARR